MRHYDSGALGAPEILTVSGSAKGDRPAHLTAGQLTLAATVATIAAIWPVGIVFVTPAPLILLAVAALVSAGATAAVARGERPGVITLLPATLLTAVVLAAAWVRAGSIGALSEGIGDVLGSGQLSQAPLPFLPAWLALTGTLSVLLAAAATVAVRATNAFAAVITTAPFVLVGAIIQPHGYLLTGVLPAVSFLLLSTAIAHAYHTAGRLSAKPLFAGLGLIAVMIAVVLSAAHMGIISAGPSAPAARPAMVLPAGSNHLGDEPIATLRADRPLPLRIGVLSTYDREGNWLLPPVDPNAITPLGHGDLSEPPSARRIGTASVQLHAEIGRFVPIVPGSYQLEGLPAATEIDQLGTTVMLPSAHTGDLTYTMRIAHGGDTPAATAPPLVAPPPQIQQALSQAPTGAWDRFEYLRAGLYERGSEVLASEPTRPLAVSAQRAVAIWQGESATSFELTATEALLASWAGLDVRIGYGWYAPHASATNTYTITAADGASWVELRDTDGQWYPLLTQPGAEAQRPTAIAPDGSRFAEVLIPLQSGQLDITTQVGYWLKRYLGFALAGLTLWLALPVIFRTWRRVRRTRWAKRRGPGAQIAVAYAEFRDLAIDFDLGNRHAAPLAFLSDFTDDEDHHEFAWLVERVLWGDLRRDITPMDVDAAERLSRSLRRRLAGAQSYLRRFVTLGSTRSLRAPYLAALPNPYPRSLARGGDTLDKATRWRHKRPLRWAVTAVVIVALVAVPLLVGSEDLRANVDETPREFHLPTTVSSWQIEPVTLDYQRSYQPYSRDAYINPPHLWLVRDGKTAVATIQAAELKSGLARDEVAVRAELLDLFGMSDVVRVGDQVIYTGQLGTLRAAMWFSPDAMSYRLLTASRGIDDPVAVLAQLIAAEIGRSADEMQLELPTSPCDARVRTCR
ncbi:MAG: hypothetical protein Q4Q03_00460 [Bowdeniella nasicola]|nr:hypothetical protein [Bowdeniella nasicola]